MEIYHVLNRGVEKRDIFLDNRDYIRFIHDMWEFNRPGPTSHAIHAFRKLDLRSPNFPQRGELRIVDVHGWCLMKNHYHLLLSERVEGGLTLFLRKLNIGYAKYFNERYKRSGYLFQGRTKKIRVNSDAYFLHILNYVHFNPLDYTSGGRNWRDRSLNDPEKAHRYLLRYKWSSYPDYCGQKNFPSILTTDVFEKPSQKFRRHLLDYAGMSSETLPVQLRLD